MSETILKKTRNWFRAVGKLSEISLSKEDCVVKLYDKGQPTGESVNAECIKGKIAVRTESGVITFPIYFASKGMDGKDAKNWKMAEAMLNWNPEINGTGEPATVVAVEGMVEPNDYVTQQGDLKYALQYRVRSANTRVQADEAHAMTLSATAFIRSIKPEMRNEEETGRLSVELFGANSKGACFPIQCLVEKELADDFDGAYESGQTVAFDIDIVVHHVGNKKGQKKAFGRGGAVNTNSGFDVTEMMIVGADEPIEEPDEKTYEDDEGNIKEVETEWIDPATMKAAFKERQKMLEEKEKIGYVDPKAGKGGKSMAERKAEKKAGKGMPKTKTNYVEDDIDSDDPF